MKTSQIITETYYGNYTPYLNIPHLFAYEFGEFKINITCNVDFRTILAVKMFVVH